MLKIKVEAMRRLPVSKSFRFIRKVSIVFVSGLLLSSLPLTAHAEGFPGVGERLKYAESLPHYNLGNRYLQKEWYEKAVEKYNDAINIYPYDADVYSNLGIALRRMNDVAGAEEAFRHAVELNDKDWTTISNLANLLMIQDRFGDSLKLFEKALKNPDLPKDEREAIHKNIFGIRKIMKNKGLLEDYDRENHPVAAKPAPAGKSSPKKPVNAKAAGGKRAVAQRASKTTARANPARTATSKPAPAASSSHVAGDGKTALDGQEYDSWLSGSSAEAEAK